MGALTSTPRMAFATQRKKSSTITGITQDVTIDHGEPLYEGVHLVEDAVRDAGEPVCHHVGQVEDEVERGAALLRPLVRLRLGDLLDRGDGVRIGVVDHPRDGDARRYRDEDDERERHELGGEPGERPVPGDSPGEEHGGGEKGAGGGNEYPEGGEAEDAEQVLLEIEDREHDAEVPGDLHELLGDGSPGVVWDGGDRGREGGRARHEAEDVGLLLVDGGDGVGVGLRRGEVLAQREPAHKGHDHERHGDGGPRAQGEPGHGRGPVELIRGKHVDGLPHLVVGGLAALELVHVGLPLILGASSQPYVPRGRPRNARPRRGPSPRLHGALTGGGRPTRRARRRARRAPREPRRGRSRRTPQRRAPEAA